MTVSTRALLYITLMCTFITSILSQCIPGSCLTRGQCSLSPRDKYSPKGTQCINCPNNQIPTTCNDMNNNCGQTISEKGSYFCSFCPTGFYIFGASGCKNCISDGILTCDRISGFPTACASTYYFTGIASDSSKPSTCTKCRNGLKAGGIIKKCS